MLNSLKLKAAIILAVFLVFPVLIYDQFRTAEMQTRDLLKSNLANEGRVIGELLRPRFQSYDGEGLTAISESLRRVRLIDGRRIKLLLHPNDPAAEDRFFFIAHAPAVSDDYLRQTRSQLMETGVLADLRDDCTTGRGDDVQVVRFGGEAEVLTSITPIRTRAGCWAVITSHGVQDRIGTVLGRPYWQMPQVQLATAFYVAMAVLVLTVAISVWRNLRRLARAAEAIGDRQPADGVSFRALNRIPELNGVAAALDRMVDTLQNAASVIRRAAEDNAHALKTPISTIAQSMEPLRRAVGTGTPQAQRSFERIDRALLRLDDLVDAAQQTDRTTAELLEAPRRPVDFGVVVARVGEDLSEAADARDVALATDVRRGLVVTGSENLLITITENLVGNALDFAPAGSRVSVALSARAGEAVLTVSDTGPGVPEGALESIFERYYSVRATADSLESTPPGEGHSGIGLWVVRRNVEALGGRVHAEPNAPSGLRVVVTIPLRA